MRVTSNTYTNLLINSSQTSQQQLANLQQQISTGESIQYASDNPLGYAQATQAQTSLSQLNSYTAAVNTATPLASANNSAMTSLHQAVAQASELLATVNGTMSTANLQAVAIQVNSLITQVTSIANQTSPTGNYLFGGTSNQQPITSTGTYNSATNADETSIEVQPGNSVTTGILAGRPGTPPVDGFLYNSTTGVDVLASLKQAVTDLNAGNVTAVQSTDVPAINSALDNVSLYVGSTAAAMSSISTAGNALAAQTTATSTQLNDLTQTNLPDVTLELQQIQTQYQASLEAGSRVLNLSILNYIGSVGAA